MNSSMQNQRFKTLDEFWPYYVRQHSQPLTRRLHFVGNTNLIMWLIVALAKRSLRLAVYAVVSSYCFAWLGHFGVEKNKPATFDYPVLSAVADIVMFWKMLNGEMDAELEKHLGELVNPFKT